VTGPLVSVVLPARDCGAYLDAAVASILGQTERRVELIVVDDHSRDGSIAGLSREDPRLRVVASPGEGIVDALNYGAALARGRYLARMDGDDLSHPQRLERQIAFLEARPDVGISGAQVQVFTNRGSPRSGYRRYQRWLNGLTTAEDIHRQMFVESPIPHPTAVLRMAVFRDLGGYRGCPWAEDYDLWLRAHRAGVAMAKPRGTLLYWRDHPQRLSRCGEPYSQWQFVLAKAHYLAAGPLRGHRALIWGASRVGARLHDALAAVGAEVAGFIDVDPRQIGGCKRGLPVYGPDYLEGCGAEVVLAAVGAPGAREEIRGYLLALGYQEGRDFVLAA